MKRIFLMLCVVVCMSLVCFPASAEVILSGNCGQSGEDLLFTLDDQGLLTISGKGHVAKTFNEYIFDYVIRKVVIEEGTLSVGEHAFDSCSDITSVSLPGSLEAIGYEAFYGCGYLTNATIPDNVTKIGMSAFGKCEGLKSVVIGSGVESIDNNVFFDCIGLKSVTFRGRKAPAINAGAFSNVNATVYYAKHKSDWNDQTIQQYGGKLTWQRTDPFTGLTITTQPDKIVYFEGECFDTTGMVVTASFEDGTNDTDIVCTVSPSGPLGLDTKNVRITYTDEDGVSKNEYQSITVLPKEVKATKETSIRALKLIAGEEAPVTVQNILASLTDKINAAMTVDEIYVLLESGVKEIQTQQESELEELKQQKEELEQQTTELKQQKAELEKQKEELEEKIDECQETIEKLKAQLLLLDNPIVIKTKVASISGSDKVKVTVSWNKIEGASYLINGTNTGAASMEFTAARGQTHTYKVQAKIVVNGEVLTGKVSSVTVKPAPAKAAIASAKNIRSKKIRIKWKKAAGAKYYQVSVSASRSKIKYAAKKTMKLTFTKSKLRKGKTYYVKVRAVDANGVKGKWSDAKKVRIKQ